MRKFDAWDGVSGRTSSRRDFYGAKWDDVVQEALTAWETDDPNDLIFRVIERPKDRRLFRGGWRVEVSCPSWDEDALRFAEDEIEREKRNKERRERKEAKRKAAIERQLEEERKLLQSKAPPKPEPEPETTNWHVLLQDWGFDSWEEFDERRK